MKKRLIALTAALLLLAGCGAKEGIEGVWEQETTVSVLGLGMETPVEEPAVQRFEFRKDGTGVMATEAEGIPATEVAFGYTLEGDTVTLVQDDGGSDMVFTVTLNGDSLKLENPRGNFDLTRAS